MNSPAQTPAQTQIFSRAVQSDFFKMAVKNAFNHIIITDIDGTILFANDAVTRITGFAPNEIIGRTPRLWGGLESKDFYKKMWKTIKVDKKSFAGEITNKRKNGQEYVAKAVISPILDEKNNLLGFIGTEEDITVLKNVDRMKSEFISIAAHQLKTPLTAISWTVENVMDSAKAGNKQELEEGLKTIDDVVKSMKLLVSSLLNVSRIESGRLIIEPKKINVHDLIDRVTKEFGVIAKQKKLKVVTIYKSELSELSVDENLMSEVVRNLLSNAIKYSQDSGKIILGTQMVDDMFVFSVTDNGVGIPKEEQSLVFHKFFRASNAQDISGTGLGLYFIREVLETAKCKLWFTSQENTNTTFFVAIPKTGMAAHQGDVPVSTSSLK